MKVPAIALLGLITLLGAPALAEEEEIPVVPRNLGDARKSIERFIAASRELREQQEQRRGIEEKTKGRIDGLLAELKEEAARPEGERSRVRIRELRGRLLDEYRKRLAHFAGPEVDALREFALQRDPVITAVGYMSAYVGKLLEGYGAPGRGRRLVTRLNDRLTESTEDLQAEFATLAAKGLYDPTTRTFAEGIPEATVRRVDRLRRQILQDRRVLAVLESAGTPERFAEKFRKIRLVLETAKGKLRDLYDRLDDQRVLVIQKLNASLEYVRAIETIEQMEDFVTGMTEAIRSLEGISQAVDGLVESLDIYVTRGLSSVADVPDIPGKEGAALEVDRTHALLRALELIEKPK